MSTTLDAGKQFVLDVFTTALEGGIGYWSKCSEYRWSTGDGSTPDPDHFYAVVTNLEDGDGGGIRIDVDVIVRGLDRIERGEIEHLHASYVRRIVAARRSNGEGDDEFDGSLDAADADIVVQAGLFGDVIYG